MNSYLFLIILIIKIILNNNTLLSIDIPLDLHSFLFSPIWKKWPKKSSEELQNKT